MASKELNRLLDRTNCEKPTEKDRKELRRYFQENPDSWQEIGSLARYTRDIVVSSIRNAAIEESTRIRMEEMKTELGYDSSPFHERLIIENILNCWVQYNLTEIGYTQVIQKGGSSRTTLTHWDRRLTAAQRRLLRGIESLAKVRKIAISAISLHFGDSQGNRYTDHPQKDCKSLPILLS